MISPRYLPAICGLLSLALVPTLIHSYGAEAAADGFSAAVAPPALAGYSSRPSERNASWGQSRFQSADWIEREYAAAGDEVRLTVVRSLDHKSLYHHPELAVAYGRRYGSSFDQHEVVHFDSRPEIPVHVLHPSAGGRAMAFYVLHYEGRFIADPLSFQLRTAAELLFSRRKPMTLFFVHDLAVPHTPAMEQLASVTLLFGAIDEFFRNGDAAGRGE